MKKGEEESWRREGKKEKKRERNEISVYFVVMSSACAGAKTVAG